MYPFEQASPNHPDRIYLEMVNHVLTNGVLKGDRTGTGTLSVFGYQARYDLNAGFPLLTTKKVHFRSVAHELLWMLQGRTDKKWLNDRKVTIWNEWNRPGLCNESNPLGDLGPVYGFQWRHFGAHYYGPNFNAGGTDQITELIKEIKQNPNSRRLVLSAWNPDQINDMALPPCHLLTMFNVTEGRLNCHFVMRSNDLCLGHPFNVASYALLTHILANICGLVPGELLYTGNDVHIYTNHTHKIKEQMERTLYDPPTLRINRQLVSVNDITYEDFSIENYNSHPAIQMEVSV